MKSAKQLFMRRKRRSRVQLRKRAKGLPRLSVFRSGRHIYAQVIDDAQGITLAAASSLEGDQKAQGGADVEAAKRIGVLIAERAVKAGVTSVVFDRGGYVYHGRVKALGDAAREGGLQF